MKTKQEHIAFWIEQSNNDWDAVQTLYKGKNYLQSLFFAHLVVEKICKSIWIKYHPENVPPRTHNLIHLLSSTPIELTEDQKEFLLTLNRFQLEGRYPDYLTKIQTICTSSFSDAIINSTNELRIWLLAKVQ